MYVVFFYQGLATHLSAKKSALEQLDGYRLRLRKSEEEFHHKEDERHVVAETLKKANAENSVKTAVESDGEEEDEEDADAGSEEDGSRGYTPSPTPAKSRAGSHVSPT
uniref:Uncharacterized protein n=1 Tax=Oryza rufipogon TaxID=4529 RepID=A0A0E0QPK3_ORYRU